MNRLGIAARFLIEPHHQPEGSLFLQHLRHHPPLVRRLQQLGHIPRRQPIAGRLITADLQPHLRDLDLRLDLQIDHAGNRLHAVLHVERRHPQFAQVVTKDLDRDLGPNPRHHVVEAMRDRLPDVGGRSRNARDPVAHIGNHLLPCPSRGLVPPQVQDGNQPQHRRPPARPGVRLSRQPDIDFRRVDPLGMFIQFGASRAAGDRQHFGNLEDQPFGPHGNPLALGQAGPRFQAQADGQRAFIERRQKLPPHPEDAGARDGHQQRHGRQNQ